MWLFIFICGYFYLDQLLGAVGFILAAHGLQILGACPSLGKTMQVFCSSFMQAEMLQQCRGAQLGISLIILDGMF